MEAELTLENADFLRCEDVLHLTSNAYDSDDIEAV
jgi:hypothetical protein